MDDRHFSKIEKKTSIALSKMAFYEILNYEENYVFIRKPNQSFLLVQNLALLSIKLNFFLKFNAFLLQT